jgi:hypothetical protein
MSKSLRGFARHSVTPRFRVSAKICHNHIDGLPDVYTFRQTHGPIAYKRVS